MYENPRYGGNLKTESPERKHLVENTTPQRDIVGLVLIIIGILLLLRNLGVQLGIGEIWPWFIVLFGIAFTAMYFSDKSQYVLLMPAFILIITGLVFAMCTIFGWQYMGKLWPLLIMSPGFGFIAMARFGQKGTALLWPGVGLIAGASIILILQSPWSRFWPWVLIVSGIFLSLIHI